MLAKAVAAMRAQQWLDQNPVFLDTETTGLGGDDEICDLALIDADGTELFNTLIRSRHPIPAEASRIHGIRDADVANAPTFADVWPDVQQRLSGRHVIIYNARFDRRFLVQSARAAGKNWHQWGAQPAESQRPHFHCAMNLYAMYCGEWSYNHNSFKWQKLSHAATCLRIRLPHDLHRAHADAELCRKLLFKLAELRTEVI